MAEEVVVVEERPFRPPRLTLENLAMSLDRLWAKVRALQEFSEDINRRQITLEAWVGKAFFIPPTVRGSSRWVLELFPDEVSQWREAIRRIPRELLTEKERGFLASLDYYIQSERKLTIPQLAWLGAIIRKAGDRLPEIPLMPRPRAGASGKQKSSTRKNRLWMPFSGYLEE